MHLQYYVHDTPIAHNTVISTNPGQTLLLYRHAPQVGPGRESGD